MASNDKLKVNDYMAMVKEAIDCGKQVTIATSGSSMLPFIVGGSDKVVLEKRNPLAVGHIVLAKVGDKYVLHRIYHIDHDHITLMGDGNVNMREHCSASQVIATAISIKKPDGTTTACLSATEMRKAAIWRNLLPLRRILLKAWKLTHCHLITTAI